MSFDTNGRTMMGVKPAELAAFVHGLSPRPAAFGANCGVGASELVTTMLNMADGVEEGDILVAKSNCGIPEFQGGEIVYSGTPELMQDYARLALDSGVRIIGGCCGTTPAHVTAMRAALEAYRPSGAKPDLETVVARLGEISTGAQAIRMGAFGPEAAEEGGEDSRRRGGRRGGRAARSRAGAAPSGN